ncbi:hypothetical protein SAMN05444359_107132 [Neolewinella agarilytica]|uniref:Uncharacterized protein n=1 Tax=Neolewinella agarilytica TaxID=478744 RepID=A0A1H9EM76_9BACT|nr:hypothetical protein SAMN05444359_107132 [Neolewinella agarilytica]
MENALGIGVGTETFVKSADEHSVACGVAYPMR